jgi:two-component system OmpR family sensor kinase
MTKPGDPGHAVAVRSAATAAEPAEAPTNQAAPRLGRRPLTLQRRLLLVIAALVTLVSAVVGIVSVAALHSQLVARLDGQLAQVTSRAAAAIDDPGGPLPIPPEGASVLLRVPGQPVGTIAALVSADSVITSGSINQQGEIVVPSDAALRTLAAVPPDREPVTVQLDELGDYRAIAAPTNGGYSYVVALPMADVNATTRQLAVTVALVALAGLAIALVLGAGTVTRALAPLGRVTDTATKVSELPLARGDVELPDAVPVDDDRTEVGRLGAAFNRMLGHVASALSAREQSERKVRRFVADASHELRTPLASIRGYAELMRLHGGELPPDLVHAIGRIESESVRMTELVEDLLLLARLDEGRELRRDRVDLSAIVRDTVGDAQVASPDHNWRVAIPDAAVIVTGDDARLRQVLANLLANARIHTPEGTNVVVRLGAVPAAADGAAPSARITVTDDGPGIDPAVRANLFERFARGDASRSRRAGSTGLGLAIVRAVVEAHRGTVDVRSEPGDTVFTVELPLAEDSGQSRSAAAEPATGATTSDVSRPSSRASSSTS